MYERLRKPGFDEVLMWNQQGEITEFTIGNVVANMDGRLVTPPVQCGLLPGTFRAWLLEQGEIIEGVIRKADLGRSRKVFMINAVRKWCEVDIRE